MANIKITDLAELAATPADADILEIVDDVAGTATSKKITAANLRADIIVADTIWDAAGDTIYGTGANTAAKLAAGAANLKYFMDADGTAPEWASGVSMITFSRDMADSTGDVAYTAAGFKPSSIEVFCVIDASDAASWGKALSTIEYSIVSNRGGLTGIFERTSRVVYIYEDIAKAQNALVKSMDVDGCTFTWTKAGLPTSIITGFILFRR